jgi:hypothetical protein
MGLFSEKDEENDDDTFVPLKKPVEANKAPKKPLFGDDSDEESAKPATSELAQAEEIK